MDCKKPIYVLRPYYFSKQSQLALKQFVVVSDGKAKIEHKFAPNEVKQEDDFGYVETATVIADEHMLDALRQIAQGGKVSIRFSGGKGSASVPTRLTNEFSQDVADALAIYDKLNAAVAGAPLKSCAALN